MLATIWDKLKAICGRSLTIAWGYLLAVFGAAMDNVDGAAALVGDPTFAQHVKTVIGTDPIILAKYAYVAAVVTISARLRGIVSKKSAS